MKKILILLGLIILVSIISVYFCKFGLKNSSKPVNNQIEPSSLVGIWQANNMMASGWADRYHFYNDGKFHFYPNQMACKENEEELIGNWEIKGKYLFLIIKSKIVFTNKCIKNIPKQVVNKKNVDLLKEESLNKIITNLSTANGDNYPSVSIGDIQYWKFSDDPTDYGGEKFSKI